MALLCSSTQVPGRVGSSMLMRLSAPDEEDEDAEEEANLAKLRLAAPSGSGGSRGSAHSSINTPPITTTKTKPIQQPQFSAKTPLAEEEEPDWDAEDAQASDDAVERATESKRVTVPATTPKPGTAAYAAAQLAAAAAAASKGGSPLVSGPSGGSQSKMHAAFAAPDSTTITTATRTTEGEEMTAAGDQLHSPATTGTGTGTGSGSATRQLISLSGAKSSPGQSAGPTSPAELGAVSPGKDDEDGLARLEAERSSRLSPAGSGTGSVDLDAIEMRLKAVPVSSLSAKNRLHSIFCIDTGASPLARRRLGCRLHSGSNHGCRRRPCQGLQVYPRRRR
jgi:hypothetical protein